MATLCILYSFPSMIAFAIGEAPIGTCVAMTAFCGVPGAAYAIATFHMSRRRPWAVTLAIVTASIQALASIGGSLLILVVFPINSARATLATFGAFYLVALGWFLSYLSRSYAAILADKQQTQRGFEPIPLTPPPLPRPAQTVEQPGEMDRV
ncbi:MAG: hypothetical protein ABSH20_29285 [Tepidisphaeraceae bacterium]